MGEISNVDLKLINNCIKSDQLPIISTIGENLESNHYFYLDINHITYCLALTLNPFKIIQLNETGGLRDENKKLILNVNIPKNGNDSLTENNTAVSFEHAGVTIDQIKFLLKSMPDHASYVITDIKVSEIGGFPSNSCLCNYFVKCF
jgi:N-acetylglutamate synthase